MDKNHKMNRKMMEQAAQQGQAGMVMSQAQQAELTELARHFEEDFTPCNDWLLIKVSTPKVTKGGVVIPDGVKIEKEPPQAVVIRTGPGAKDEDGNLVSMKFKPGDVVYPVFTGMRPALQFPVGDGTVYYVAAAECIVGVSSKHNSPERVEELKHA